MEADFLIKRELYMSRIRPFIGTDLVKVMTGIRRCGKSVMLDLIKEELKESGVPETQFVAFNFEDMRNANLCTAQALHYEVVNRASEISGKVYLFFDEIQEVTDWEKCINSLRVEMDCDIYITGSNATCSPVSLRPSWVVDMWNLRFIRSHMQNLWNSIETFFRMLRIQ